MNKARISGFALEKAVADKLRELLGGVPWLKDWKVQRALAAFRDDAGFDITATLPLPGGITAELHVECKADPRPSQFPYVDVTHYYQPASKPQVFVFAAPYISPRMAEICQKHGWSWFDLAGNYRLSVPGVLHLERTGQEPVHGPQRRSANLGTPEAARVIRALLATDNAGRKWTQQDLRLHSQPNVSIGLVNKVVRHLHDEAFIEDLPDGGFKLHAPLELLTAWRDAYRFDRHQRRSYFTLLQGRQLQEKLAPLESIIGGHAAYAAFSAADFQAPHVRQPKTWVFVSAEWEDAFRDAAEAKLVDSGENLVVLIPADEGVFYLREGEADRLACTNAVQTYVDLFHCGGRGEEAAEALLEQNLKRAWKARGLL
ncbi:MAG: hypothetical protein ABSF95_11460 [Verrucomicrobiota bacterium]|jgi:hypothetical protein